MFKINGEYWDISFVSPYSSILRNNDGHYTLGVTIPEWRKIYIANNIYGSLLKHVLAHEVSHAEFASRGLFVPIYVEEVLADILADNILDVETQTNALCRLYGKC